MIFQRKKLNKKTKNTIYTPLQVPTLGQKPAMDDPNAQ